MVECKWREATSPKEVTVLFREDDDTFEVDAETERMLLESIAQCDRGETVPLEQVLAELRRRE
jgi:hypothetical protein